MTRGEEGGAPSFPARRFFSRTEGEGDAQEKEAPRGGVGPVRLSHLIRSRRHEHLGRECGGGPVTGRVGRRGETTGGCGEDEAGRASFERKGILASSFSRDPVLLWWRRWLYFCARRGRGAWSARQRPRAAS